MKRKLTNRELQVALIQCAILDTADMRRVVRERQSRRKHGDTMNHKTQARYDQIEIALACREAFRVSLKEKA